jgi:hypothetical protein
MKLSPTTVDQPRVMYWRRSFPGRAEQAKQVRLFVAYLMSDSPIADQVSSVAEKLANNAIRHSSPDGRIGVALRRLRSGDTSVAVTGQGGHDRPCCLRISDAEGRNECDRELAAIVAASSRWSCHRDASGHTVTVVFR